MCTPALRALRSRYKDSYIAFLTEKESSDLLSLNPYLNEVIVLDRERYRSPLYSVKKTWEVRKSSFDLVIDFFGNPRSAYFSCLSGAKHRLGYDHPLRKYFYNMIIKEDKTPKYAAQSRLDFLKNLGIGNWTYPDFSRQKFVKKEVDCPDCEKIKHSCTKLSCLDLITVEDVQKTFTELLSQLKEKTKLEKLEHIAVDQR